MDSNSKDMEKPQFQEIPTTLEHQVQIQGTQHEERRQRKFHTRPQDHKPVQVKFTRQPFPESSKLFDNCFQEHPQVQVEFKLHGQQFQNSGQHTEQQQNML